LLSELQTLKGEHRVNTTIYYLSYRPPPTEAGSERTFDYSERSLATRWHAGAADMRRALSARVELKEGVCLIPVRGPDNSSIPD